MEFKKQFVLQIKEILEELLNLELEIYLIYLWVYLQLNFEVI
jgi:hypothetical protein